jgi:predicted phosphodiesterase
LIHHHFNKLKLHSKSTFGSLWGNIEKQTMKLRNKRRLFNLFNEFNVDVVLHGHVHESKEYFRKGVRFLNAGATIKNNHHSVIVNYLRLSKGKININIETIRLPEIKREDNSKSNRNDYIKLISAALIS